MVLVRVGPDLAVTALTAPGIAGPGSTVIVNDTTKNQGGGNAAGTPPASICRRTSRSMLATPRSSHTASDRSS